MPLRRNFVSVLVLIAFTAMAVSSVDTDSDPSGSGSSDSSSDFGSSDSSSSSANAYDFEGSYSTEVNSLYTTIKFEVEIFNLSDSETMTINLWDSVSYTIDGNKHTLMGMPEDAHGNSIETTIAPGRSKTVYYSDMRQGDVSGTIGFTYEYGASGWVRGNR